MVYKTNNPLEYAQVDGIVADEQAPAPQVRAEGTGIAILVGQFAWGAENVLSGSFSKNLSVLKTYMSSSYSGNDALANKSFSLLKIIRAVASDAVKASLSVQDATPEDSITFTAKYKGVKGNSIKITIEDGSDSGKKYTIALDDSANVSYFPNEIYDNVTRETIAEAMANSKLVDVAVIADMDEPENIASTALTSGSDGTIADTDYETAINVAKQEKAGNILFLDVYNETRNGYIKTAVSESQEMMGILAGPENETVAEAKVAVATLRDVDGRFVYANNWVQTTIRGAKVFMSPASFYASVLSNIGPHIDPAFAGNSQYLYGVSDVKNKYSRAEFIELMDAGISAFEFDSDIGFKIKSGVVTQIANSEKVTVTRRRMTDFLIASHSAFLKNYQNAVNSSSNRIAVQSAMVNFIENNLEKNEVLPKDSEVQGGNAKIVDIETLNDDDSIGQGYFYILYKQRIWSSMRFIVLKAEVGTGVVVEA